MTVKSLPLEHLFHRGKPFLIHSVQLDYPENTEKHFCKERQNLHLHLSICMSLTSLKHIIFKRDSFLAPSNSYLGRKQHLQYLLFSNYRADEQEKKPFNICYESLLCAFTVS